MPFLHQEKQKEACQAWESYRDLEFHRLMKPGWQADVKRALGDPPFTMDEALHTALDRLRAVYD